MNRSQQRSVTDEYGWIKKREEDMPIKRKTSRVYLQKERNISSSMPEREKRAVTHFPLSDPDKAATADKSPLNASLALPGLDLISTNLNRDFFTIFFRSGCYASY